ncbi:MAG: hypothetical protein K2X03_15775 [Bryobacteraceae bacterium]|nr:hypothetical protein [Bryobacteraceae bacterium]
MRWFNLSGGGSQTETRQYNASGQLTRLTVPGQLDFEYRFSATANDGRATSQKDYISGDELEYQYDSLGRLTRAETTANSGTAPQWGLSWVFDGFGNRLQQNAVKGTVPTSSLLVDRANNRVQSHSYDANGNTTNAPGPGAMTYDVLNRLKTVASDTYSYAPTNQRLWKNNDFVLWGADGARLVTAQLAVIGGELRFTPSSFDSYSHGRRLQVSDRLGSVGSYYPYGEAKSGTVSNADGFATYYRDSTDLDYAQNRHYQSTTGRFTTTDPLQASAKLSNPASWNRYDCASGDPANRFDPDGLAATPSTVCRWDSALELNQCTTIIYTDYGLYFGYSTGDTEQIARKRSQTAAAGTISWDVMSKILNDTASQVGGSASLGGMSASCLNYLGRTIGRLYPGFFFSLTETIPEAIGRKVRENILGGPGGSPAAVSFVNGFTTNAEGGFVQRLFRDPTIYVRAYVTSSTPGIIYWRPGDNGIGISTWWLHANIIHETFHLLGLNDNQLQRALGVEEDDSYTDNITEAIAINCYGVGPLL